MRRPGAALAAVVMLLGLSVATWSPTTAQAASAAKLTTSVAHPVRGTTFVVSGSFSTKVVRPVDVQRWSARAWKTIATIPTGADGAFWLRTSTTATAVTLRAVAKSVTIGGKHYAKLVSASKKITTASQRAFQLSSSRDHSCVLTRGGAVKCWGRSDGAGQLGDGVLATRSTPVQVRGLSSGAIQVGAGGYHSCALTGSGGVECWGSNGDGRIGDGSSVAARPTPVTVKGLSSGVVEVAAGEAHTCARTDGGQVKCWGYNGNGELGDGTTVSRKTPVAVKGLTSGVVALAAGGFHTCALMSSGTVKCWGGNVEGRLGDGTTVQRTAPVKVANLTNVVAIAAGRSHTCALVDNGHVFCWGYNASGQLGDGTVINQLLPVRVKGLTKVRAVSAGASHTCAVLTSGRVKCWGGNGNGRLGDGTTKARRTPVYVKNLSGVTDVAAAGRHSCAITKGRVACWGSGSDGQLGNGSRRDHHVPVYVRTFEG